MQRIQTHQYLEVDVNSTVIKRNSTTCLHAAHLWTKQKFRSSQMCCLRCWPCLEKNTQKQLKQFGYDEPVAGSHRFFPTSMVLTLDMCIWASWRCKTMLVHAESMWLEKKKRIARDDSNCLEKWCRRSIFRLLLLESNENIQATSGFGSASVSPASDTSASEWVPWTLESSVSGVRWNWSVIGKLTTS